MIIAAINRKSFFCQINLTCLDQGDKFYL